MCKGGSERRCDYFSGGELFMVSSDGAWKDAADEASDVPGTGRAATEAWLGGDAAPDDGDEEEAISFSILVRSVSQLNHQEGD